MAYRELIDADGAIWQVWDTHPATGTRLSEIRGTAGWLTFQKDSSERRRLLEVPADWEVAPENLLREWLSRAQAVTLRMESSRRDNGGSEAPEGRRASDYAPPLTASADETRAVLDANRATLERARRAIDESRTMESHPEE